MSRKFSRVAYKLQIERKYKTIYLPTDFMIMFMENVHHILNVFN